MKRSPLIGGLAVAAALTLAFAAPAFAGPVEVVHWEEADSVVHEVGEEGWCPADVVDFEVAHSWEASGIDRFTTQRDGLLLVSSTSRSVDSYSANGKTFVLDRHSSARGHKIADNGDGTLTVWLKESVRLTVLLDGEVLYHDSGLSEGAILIDHGGTPTDPTDDEFIGVAEEFELHGRWDTADRDFCEDIATHLGA